MLQLMQLGHARDVIQSMDKQDVITGLVIVITLLAVACGYLAGTYNA
jgi:hypothetical protein